MHTPGIPFALAAALLSACATTPTQTPEQLAEKARWRRAATVPDDGPRYRVAVLPFDVAGYEKMNQDDRERADFERVYGACRVVEELRALPWVEIAVVSPYYSAAADFNVYGKLWQSSGDRIEVHYGLHRGDGPSYFAHNTDIVDFSTAQSKEFRGNNDPHRTLWQLPGNRLSHYVTERPLSVLAVELEAARLFGYLGLNSGEPPPPALSEAWAHWTRRTGGERQAFRSVWSELDAASSTLAAQWHRESPHVVDEETAEMLAQLAEHELENVLRPLTAALLDAVDAARPAYLRWQSEASAAAEKIERLQQRQRRIQRQRAYDAAIAQIGAMGSMGRPSLATVNANLDRLREQLAASTCARDEIRALGARADEVREALTAFTSLTDFAVVPFRIEVGGRSVAIAGGDVGTVRQEFVQLARACLGVAGSTTGGRP